MESPKDVFERLLAGYGSEAAALLARHRFWAGARVIVFSAGLVALVYCANARWGYAAGGVLAVFGAAFYFLIKKHQSVAEQKELATRLADVNREETARLKGDFENLPADGEIYSDPLHFYSGDLDIFGENSLFQYVNRSGTRGGQDLLAAWLSGKSGKKEILERQEAVKELAGLLEFRQKIQAYSHIKTQKEAEETGKNPLFISRKKKKPSQNLPIAPSEESKLLAWLQEPALLLSKKWLPNALLVLPFVAPACLGLWLADLLHPIFVLAALGVNLAVLKSTFEAIVKIAGKTDDNAKRLSKYADLARLTEEAVFTSPLAVRLRGELTQNGLLASGEIKQLSVILMKMEYRNNPYFYLFVNIWVLFDLRWAVKSEKWKSTAGQAVGGWIKALEEIEALGSLAGFAYAHPSYVFPEISEGEAQIQAVGLGHPLLFSDGRVLNDFATEGLRKTVVVTGSNMSGKSTFLRTLGINAALALAGAPVCAQKFRVSPVRLFTSMRTKDSLSDSTSSFYAELKRLKMLLEYLDTPDPVPVFFLLDEILKGTNSKDRQEGTKAVVRQLHGKKTSGLLATHDLEIAEMADELPGFIENISFNSHLENGQLSFDYKIYPGVCRSFNAGALMALMGIGEVKSEK